MLRIFTGLCLLTGIAAEAQNARSKFYRTELDVNINAAFKNVIPKAAYNSNKLTLAYKGIFKNRYVIYWSFSKYFDGPGRSIDSRQHTQVNDSTIVDKEHIYNVHPGSAIHIGYQYLFKPKRHFQQALGLYIHSVTYKTYRSTWETYVVNNTSYAFMNQSQKYFIYKGYGLTPNYTLHYFIYKGLGASCMIGYDMTRYTKYDNTDVFVGGLKKVKTFYSAGPKQLFLDLNVFVRF